MAEKVVVGLCSYKGPDVHCFQTHLELWFRLGRLAEAGKYEFLQAWEIGNSLIGQARDRVCEVAIDGGADWVLMYDDDMRFKPDIFERLVAHNKLVVGALAFTGRQPICPVIYKFKKEWDAKQQAISVDIQPVLDYPRDSLVACDALGTGVILIKSEVLKRIEKPWFYGSLSCGEDILFAWKCKKAGIQIYCDTATKTLHRPNEPLFWHGEEFYDVCVNNSNPNLQKLSGADPVPTIPDQKCGVPVSSGHHQ